MCVSLTGLWWKSREIVIFPFTTDLGFIGCMWMWICQDFFHIFFSFSIYTYPSYLALFLIYTTLHGNGWFWVSLPQILLDLCLQDSSSQLICFGFSSIFQVKVSLLCSFLEPARVCEKSAVFHWARANKPHVPAGFIWSEEFSSPLMLPQSFTSQQEGTRKKMSLWILGTFPESCSATRELMWCLCPVISCVKREEKAMETQSWARWPCLHGELASKVPSNLSHAGILWISCHCIYGFHSMKIIFLDRSNVIVTKKLA